MTTTLLNNRYQVIQVLGAGGFGETFLAEDIHMPSRRRCVIKQLKPITNDPKTYQLIQQRFEREAATLEFLGEGSDQIPKLYAYFSENGQFYLVQEWIQGHTLTQVVQSKGVLSETQVWQILSSLLSVLNYVHSKGIIHRDIKPDNIILQSQNNKPVLIDFGAVKETVRSIMTPSGNLTQSLVIGTPGYMPSEQAIGRPVYGTDLFSLGMTAIYLLIGRHPHELETHPQTGEVIWHNQAPKVSPHLAMVLNQAIKPHANERYTTASKMLYALQSATSPPTITPNGATQATLTLSPNSGISSQPTNLAPSNQKNPVIPSSNSPNWQKPAWIAGSLVVGSLIAVAIATVTNRPEPEAPVATSPAPTPLPEATTTPTTSPIPVTTPPSETREQRRIRVVVPPPPDPAASNPVFNNEPPQEPVETSVPSPPVASIPEEKQESSTSQSESDSEDRQSSVAGESDEDDEQETSSSTAETSKPPKQENDQVATANTSGVSVPAFPVGTSEDAVKGALGNPTKVSRGLWKTRAYLYKIDPNRVDLGYLFDRKTGVLRQTEVSFAQSVEPSVMETTLQGMLGSSASSEIKQGLQQVYDRRRNQFSFNVNGLEGVIERNREDQIYIAIWDADLH